MSMNVSHTTASSIAHAETVTEFAQGNIVFLEHACTLLLESGTHLPAPRQERHIGAFNTTPQHFAVRNNTKVRCSETVLLVPIAFLSTEPAEF